MDSKWLPIVCLAAACGFSNCIAPMRKLNALWNFCSVIECSTGLNCWHYDDYGCWCGWGGTGDPLDAIDDCCQQHDHCYAQARTAHFCLFGKFDHYTFDCISMGETDHNRAICSHKNSRCEQIFCECDILAGDCFAQQPPPPKKLKCPRSKFSVFR